MNGEDTSSSSSEEEKEGHGAPAVAELSLKPSWASGPQREAPPSTDRQEEEEDNEEDEGSCLPTIFFSHTVEPKKVRTINTWEPFVDFSLKDSVVQFSTDSVFSSLRRASGEDKHGKKHHAEVQRKERAEGTLQEEKEKQPQQRTRPPRTSQNHNASRHLQVKTVQQNGAKLWRPESGHPAV